MRGSRDISLVPSLHRASTDALIYIKQQTLKNTSETRLVATVVLLHNRGWGSWVSSIWDGTSLSDREQSPPGEVRPRNALRTSL